MRRPAAPVPVVAVARQAAAGGHPSGGHGASQQPKQPAPPLEAAHITPSSSSGGSQTHPGYSLNAPTSGSLALHPVDGNFSGVPVLDNTAYLDKNVRSQFEFTSKLGPMSVDHMPCNFKAFRTFCLGLKSFLARIHALPFNLAANVDSTMLFPSSRR